MLDSARYSVICPARSHLLLSGASLVAYAIIAHLLLNAMWFPLQ